MGRAALIAWVAVGCLASTACNRRILGVLFDLPENEPAVAAPPQALPAGVSLESLTSNVFMMPVDTIVPDIEKTLDPDSVVAMLPRDHAGNIDWMAALRHEIVRPRNGIDGPRTDLPGAFDFKFDFYFPGPVEMFDALFPHSSHTEWMECAQCHPRIFRTRGEEIKMADIFAGKFCGECHGKVAFPVMTGCERCHTDLPQPPDRAQPELIGTIEMRRASEILAERRADSLAALPAAAQPAIDTSAVADSLAVDPSTGSEVSIVARTAARVNMDDFPRAQFPHWVHRIRYRCKTCHMSIFEPKAGTNVVTMLDIGNGEACGQCHDGTTAFSAGIQTCDRCHPAPETPPVPAPAPLPPRNGGGRAP